jgi:hypothetical protein
MELHRGGSGGWELFDLDFNVQPVLKTFGAAVTVGVDVKVILAPPLYIFDWRITNEIYRAA